MKPNYHNFRTNNDIGIKLGPVAKHSKKKGTASKKSEADVMLKNCEAIVIFPFYG